MNIFAGLEKIVETDYPLARCTWYRLGGPADYFIQPQNTEQLREVVQRCNENNLRYYVIGSGTNVLVSDEGVRGAVIRLSASQFRRSSFKGELLTAWAGAELGKLVRESAQKGLSGLEALTGIPGSVGGAVKMNAGGRFGDIGSVVESVTLMDHQGNVFEKSKPELTFDYRRTNITARFILSAKMKLTPAEPEQILRTIKEVWIYKENNQPPLNTRNSGCVFKNPGGTPAGILIDRAGLKGLRVGGAVVSDKHANFIIADEGCTSRDIVRLMEIIREKVKEKFGVELENELEIWS